MRTQRLWLIVVGMAVFIVSRVTAAQLVPAQENVALQKPVAASSVESTSFPAHHANDGNPDTRWSSQFDDNEWIYIDLETAYELHQVVLNWEAAYGQSYDIDTSIDGLTWETIFEERDGQGGVDVIDFETPVPARFVRMTGLARGTGWGYSLWEFEIFGLDPTPRYVAGDGTNGGNDCLDAGNPCATITHAIGQADPGNIIQIAAGTYTESLMIDKSLTLQGAGQNSTIIQAHLMPGVAGERVITIPAGLAVALSDVTIRHGQVSGSGTAGEGGGIFSSGSTLALTGVTLMANEARSGGGLYNKNNGAVALTAVTFSGNTATAVGGGMRNFAGSSSTLLDVTFTGNEADRGGGMANNTGSHELVSVTFSGNMARLGGGLYNVTSSPALTGVAFSDNTAGDHGGGMYNTNSSPTLTDVIFSANSANSDGGGMYNLNNSSPIVTAVTFTANEAGDHGGGIYNEESEMTITSATIAGNIASRFGGGIHNRLGDMTISSAAITGNQADFGGGAYNYFGSTITLTNARIAGNEGATFGGGIYNDDGGTVVLTNAEITGNTTGKFGGGIYNNDAEIVITNATIAGNEAEETGGGIRSEGEAILINTVIWGNTASGNGNEIFNYDNSSVYAYYTLYKNEPGDIVEGGNFIVDEHSLTEDPLFADAANGDLHLQEGSPAINAADPDTDLLLFATDGQGNPVDLDGNPRVQDGRIDMGAYEFQVVSGGPHRLYLPIVTK